MKRLRKMIGFSRLIIAVLIFLFIFILLHFILPLDRLNALFNNFNKAAIGISALIAAYAGALYFIEEFKRRSLIDLYRKRYPHTDYEKRWKIIVREDRTGEPHILDINKKIKYHIWNMKTIYDLGWQFYDREPISKKEFDSFNIGEFIRTRGELGE